MDGDVTSEGKKLVKNSDYLQEIEKLREECNERYESVKAKLKRASGEVKNIVEVKRLIKWNKKLESQRNKKANGSKAGVSTKGNKKNGKSNKINQIIHIPFIVLKYKPEHPM